MEAQGQIGKSISDNPLTTVDPERTPLEQWVAEAGAHIMQHSKQESFFVVNAEGGPRTILCESKGDLSKQIYFGNHFEFVKEFGSREFADTFMTSVFPSIKYHIYQKI
jgi:hypothetical protein